MSCFPIILCMISAALGHLFPPIFTTAITSMLPSMTTDRKSYGMSELPSATTNPRETAFSNSLNKNPSQLTAQSL